MAFFDKLNDIAKNIGDKTSEAIETTKLNNTIHSEKKAATEDFKKIGEYYYNQFIAEGEGAIAADVLEVCQSAKAHFDRIQETQAEIDRIKAESKETSAEATPAEGAAAEATAAEEVAAETTPAEAVDAAETSEVGSDSDAEIASDANSVFNVE